MADKRQHFFIYERKEMFILFALGSFIALFAFTLGVHLGKKQTLEQYASTIGTHDGKPIESQPDEVPSNIDMSEQMKNAQGAASDALSQELQNEVAETGIKLDKKVQVDLPTQKKQGAKPTEVTPVANKGVAFQQKAPTGKFTLQVGSFSSVNEAEDRAKVLRSNGLEPFLREANIRGKGHWFRIYLGGFGSVKEAKTRGAEIVGSGKIESFVVAPMPGV